MLFIAILTGTLVAGVGSVWIAGALTFGVLARLSEDAAEHLLSLAAGALLATAFMHLLPEAFESQAGAHALFATLLGGLIFFFLLDKAELYHHGHEHGHSHDHSHANERAHEHEPGHAHPEPRRSGSWAVLAGDSVHAFGDGVLLAGAYTANLYLGLAATVAVLAHEVPHHVSDLVVLRSSLRSQRSALVMASAAGAVTALGGLAGYLLLDQLADALPYLLVVASSSFVYVALADLIPQLQKRLSGRQTLAQLAWLLAGIAAITLVSGLGHAL